MVMDITQTQRGFSLGEFIDRYGNKCSLQKSSLATEDAIWLGIDKPKLTIFEDSSKGKYIITEMPSNFDVDSRMHLTQDMVKELLPYLISFAETGELPLKAPKIKYDITHSFDFDMKSKDVNHYPDVSLKSNILTIKGRSSMQDAISFYGSLFDKLTPFLFQNKKKLTFVVDLEYLKSESEKMFVNLLNKLNNQKLEVKWYYEKDDEDHQEKGLDFKNLFHNMNFKLIKKK